MGDPRQFPAVNTATPLPPVPTAPVSGLLAETPTPAPAVVITPLPDLQRFDQLTFVDAQTAYASLWPDYDWNAQKWVHFSRLLRTVDGGRTWNDITPPGVLDGFLADALDADHLWYLSHSSLYPTPPPENAAIFRSTDGGQTWQKLAAPSTGGGIHMFDPNNGWGDFAAMDCSMMQCPVRLYTTSNGGQTWDLYQPSGDLPKADMMPPGTFIIASGMGIDYASMDTLWIGGGSTDWAGMSLKVSRDRGKTFQMTSFSVPQGLYPQYLNLPVFLNENDGFLVINAITNQTVNYNDSDEWVYVILATQDGGHTWTPRPLLTGFGPRGSVQFVTRTDWFAKCQGQLCRTNDSGQTWQALPLPHDLAAEYFSFTFVDPQNGWGMMNFSATDNRYYRDLYITHDGGQTWEKVNPREN